MPKIIFGYWRNISEHPQSVRNKPIAEKRYVDELPCAPGGHVRLVNGTFTIQPGQIVRFPSEFALAGGLHKRPFLVHVTHEDFLAAAKAPPAATEPEPEPEPESEPPKRKRGRPKGSKNRRS